MTDITLPRAVVQAALDILDAIELIEGPMYVSACRELRTALAQPQAEPSLPSLEADGPQFDEYFDKHVDTLAKKHPSLLVRQLARRLRDLKAQPATQQPEWVPLTQGLLHAQHPWLYEPMWIALKDGGVVSGRYEWQQGRNPDQFITDAGQMWAFNATHVMPIKKPPKPGEAQPATQYVAQAPGPVVHVGSVMFPPVEAQPATQPRKPLTDEQLRKMHHEDQFGLFCDYDEFEQIARAVEQAHGITGETK